VCPESVIVLYRGSDDGSMLSVALSINISISC